MIELLLDHSESVADSTASWRVVQILRGYAIQFVAHTVDRLPLLGSIDHELVGNRV